MNFLHYIKMLVPCPAVIILIVDIILVGLLAYYTHICIHLYNKKKLSIRFLKKIKRYFSFLYPTFNLNLILYMTPARRNYFFFVAATDGPKLIRAHGLPLICFSYAHICLSILYNVMGHSTYYTPCFFLFYLMI